MHRATSRIVVLAIFALALVLVACGGDGADDQTEEPEEDRSTEDASEPEDSEEMDEAEDEPGDSEDTDDPEDSEGEDDAEDPEALTEAWDAGADVRVTYEYEADFHESDEPATMILARRDGDQSLRWEQAGIQAHVNPDADPPFTCTAQGGGEWECFGGDNRPEGYQLERSFLGEDEEMVAALADGSDDEVAGREVRCADVDAEGLQGTICADLETGVMMSMEGETPDGAVSATATEFGEPSDADFEAPAEVETL